MFFSRMTDSTNSIDHLSLGKESNSVRHFRLKLCLLGQKLSKLPRMKFSLYQEKKTIPHLNYGLTHATSTK
jgi:hypothetical protein